jgi:hypothetical protein
MVDGLLSIVGLKLKSPPSIGTRGESRGATQVKRVALTKISLCDATGKGASVTLSGTPQICGYTLAL